MDNPSPAPITSFNGDYRWLSNFWHARVILDGVSYPTVENAYQAAKTLVPLARERFERCTPGEAKRLGRKVKMRSDWERVKLAIMRDLIAQKFAPGSRLAASLLATGKAEIIEGNSWGDRFWGVCNGTGQNHLGRLLMERRAILAGEAAEPPRPADPEPRFAFEPRRAMNDRTGGL